MSPEEYSAWNLFIQIANALISAVVGFVVWIYTRETKLLRQATDEQLALAREQARNARMPFVIPRLSSFDPGGVGFSNAPILSVPSRFSTRIGNSSDHPAIYTHIVVKLNDRYFMSREPIELLKLEEIWVSLAGTRPFWPCGAEIACD